MSETAGAATGNPPDGIRLGTCGTPMPGVEIDLAADGELLVRGPMVMRGYRDNPGATAEAFVADGWLRTGDIAHVADALRLDRRPQEGADRHRGRQEHLAGERRVADRGRLTR